MSKNNILSVKNLSISYEPTYYRSRTLRDVFVNAITHPGEFIFKSKDRLTVLHNISFDVKAGEIVGIIGVNGAGKTSLCRYLAGIHPSKDVKTTGDVRAVFDTNIGVFPDLTGRENARLLVELLYPALIKEEKIKLMEEAIVFSDIKEFIDTPFKNYSRGMKARLYLALVTARPCDLLVLDEVFGGTDIFFTEKISMRVKQLISRSGAAIMVSHSAEEIQSYCNRVIILSENKIIFDGEVEEGIKRYLELA